jgi:hypothetical protein
MEEHTMKKAILLTALALLVTSLAGCNTCRRLTGGWFNKGDRCDDFPPADCPPGMPRATMMYPGTPQVLPGPIEMAPVN